MIHGFVITKISNKHKLLSRSNLPPLFYQPLPFWGKMYHLTPHFLENKQNSNPHLICNVGFITTSCFIYLLLKIKPVMIKTFDYQI